MTLFDTQDAEQPTQKPRRTGPKKSDSVAVAAPYVDGDDKERVPRKRLRGEESTAMALNMLNTGTILHHSLVSNLKCPPVHDD
jgi:hypothetical protein